MAGHQPHTITLSELEKAVTAAVHQLQHQKAQGAQEIDTGRFIMGRWIRTQIPQAEAHAAAQEITRQVSAQVAGLKAEPFSESFPGGSTMGFVLREE
jgi:hypothetical protein